ncbi:hypothetical protein PYJP_15700 [Pyrofollis japonicus]|uniref:hypothetical protein n=1 Tax=Pyrofollis japonicus TaxID=3060460 RepID=UPI00295AA330|nr:hypothetical protein [Pyrofollis japonicus]BEP18218.1 hypothetical protein PYJP_15700 [Pyrofollis japonicus]
MSLNTIVVGNGLINGIVLFLLFVLLILVASLAYLMTSSRKGRSTEIAQPSLTATTVTTRMARGGGGGGGVSAATGREEGGHVDLIEDSELPPPSTGPREPIDAVRSRVLLSLIEKQAVPLVELEQHIRADKEYIMQALRELESKGLARIEGDVVIISERGEKIITKLREKYAEKSNWYESL